MKRRALFVGVDEYDDPQIRNLRFSRIDAHSLNELFADVGYDVKYLPNPTKAEVLAAVRERTDSLGGGVSAERQGALRYAWQCLGVVPVLVWGHVGGAREASRRVTCIPSATCLRTSVERKGKSNAELTEDFGLHVGCLGGRCHAGAL